MHDRLLRTLFQVEIRTTPFLAGRGGHEAGTWAWGHLSGRACFRPRAPSPSDLAGQPQHADLALTWGPPRCAVCCAVLCCPQLQIPFHGPGNHSAPATYPPPPPPRPPVQSELCGHQIDVTRGQPQRAPHLDLQRGGQGGRNGREAGLPATETAGSRVSAAPRAGTCQAGSTAKAALRPTQRRLLAAIPQALAGAQESWPAELLRARELGSCAVSRLVRVRGPRGLQASVE